MAKTNITLRYDGPALSGHQMDVAYLAPALFSIGELCKFANSKFNEDRAGIKVLVSADHEQQCFQISFDVVVSLYQHAQQLIGREEVKDAKALLEWLGILVTTGGSALGLVKFLAWRKGREIANTSEIRDSDGNSLIQVTVEGDNNKVTVYPETWELAKSREAIRNAQRIVEPLSQEGYERIDFAHNSHVVESLDRNEAVDILANDVSDLEQESPAEEPQTITAWVRVYSPVYDPSQPKWRFRYGDSVEYMDIQETSIAQDAIKRGGALVDDAYRVKLEITQTETTSGKFKNRYKIVEVLDFKPARLHVQQDLLEDDGENE